MDTVRKKLDLIDQIRDCVEAASPQSDPFLYYLPEILVHSEFNDINLSNVLSFVRMIQNNNQHPMLNEAVQILNTMVVSQDGRIQPPGPHMFYNTQYFFWKELGERTKANEVIMHIINKTVFTLSLENTR